MSKSALIIVDVQNDFLTGTLALKNCPAKEDGEEIIETVNKLSSQNKWDLIVYTMDWHPSDHISFVTNAHKFKQHSDSKVDIESAEVYDVVTFDIDSTKREQLMWPPHCIQGSWGAELHQGLLVSIPEKSVMIKKGINSCIDSYSAFFDNQRLSQTELKDLLKENGIERNFICGVATDVCVNYTVLDSLSLEFQTYMIEDACRGVSSENILNVKKTMKEKGIHLVRSDQVSSLLSQT